MEKNILVVTTGGTIAMKNERELMSGAELLQHFPSFEGLARLQLEEFTVLNSAALLPKHWLHLDELLNRQLADPNLAGAILLHGTDSLEETAFFLNLSLKSHKPVVIVGAMRYATAPSTDATANLYSAVRLACCEAAAGKGVLVLLNEQINTGRDVMKYDNLRLQTFRSPYGPLGTVDPDTIVFYRQPTKLHTLATEFELSEYYDKSLPKIPILSDYTGYHYELHRSMAKGDIDGVVIQSFAGGRMSDGMKRMLEDLQAAGLPTVIASRIMEGRIYDVLGQEELIFAEDLSPQKARILLMLGLLKGARGDELREMFRKY